MSLSNVLIPVNLSLGDLVFDRQWTQLQDCIVTTSLEHSKMCYSSMQLHPCADAFRETPWSFSVIKASHIAGDCSLCQEHKAMDLTVKMVLTWMP